MTESVDDNLRCRLPRGKFVFQEVCAWRTSPARASANARLSNFPGASQRRPIWKRPSSRSTIRFDSAGKTRCGSNCTFAEV
jgi:hypothetical protein